MSLPDVLTAVVQLEWGAYASVAVFLPRPGRAPLVRARPGLLAVGPGWANLLHISDESDSRAGSAPLMRLEYLDPQLEGSPGLTITARADEVVQAMNQHGLRLDDGSRGRWVGHDELLVSDAGTGSHVRRPGPGRGFGLLLVDGRLELELPRTDPGGGFPILDKVERILGSWWLVHDELPGWQREILDQQFKQVAVLVADQGHVQVDGRMGEWRMRRALAVDDAAQVLSGSAGWSGPTDGGFGVSAQYEGDTVYLAVRVRDDVILPGLDLVDILLPDDRIPVLLDPDGGVQRGSRWKAVFSEPLSYGTAFELEIQEVQLDSTQEGQLPLIVQFEDHDLVGPPTRLGTAAAPDLVYASARTMKPDPRGALER